MKFAASLDKTALGLTALVTIIFAAIISRQLVLFNEAGEAGPLYVAGSCLLIYGLAFAFRPAGYSITEKEVIIHRPLWNARIRRAAIGHVAALPAQDISTAIRLFGVGGLFGYYGTYANSPLGRMTWYATRRDTPVLLKTADNKKYILTPDEPGRFAGALAA